MTHIARRARPAALRGLLPERQGIQNRKQIQFGCPRSTLLATVRGMVGAVLLIYHGTVPDMTRKFFS